MGWHRELQLSVQKQHDCWRGLCSGWQRSRSGVPPAPSLQARVFPHSCPAHQPARSQQLSSAWSAQGQASCSLRGAVVSWEQLEHQHCPGRSCPPAGTWEDEVLLLLLLLGDGSTATATNAAQINEVHKSRPGEVLLSPPRTLCFHKHPELLTQFFAFNATDGFKTNTAADSSAPEGKMRSIKLC